MDVKGLLITIIIVVFVISMFILLLPVIKNGIVV